MSSEAAPALECRDISVSYGDVRALSEVSVSFAPNLIHAVVGQNGAGKTTFARTAAGLVTPTRGALMIDGHAIGTGRVSQSRRAGVALVHQSFALPPSFTVAEAMEFGAKGRGRVFSRRSLEARWKQHLAEVGIGAGLRERIRDLPVEVQQGVEIARALVTEARVLILDEPTAVLSPPGIERLFERLRALTHAGVTIVVILHKIREVMAIADTVSVLRGGRLVQATKPLAATGADEIAGAIIGTADVASGDPRAATGTTEVAATPDAAGVVLALTHVNTAPDAEGPTLDDITLSIGRGEIVGVAGVEGNGQRTLVRLLANLVGLRSGSVTLAGADIARAPLIARRAKGLRIIPFERNVEGLSLTSALWENWASRTLALGGMLRFITPTEIRRRCDAALRRWNVRYASSSQVAGSLSGGNAQKLILAREIDDDALLVVAAQPTRGLDVGATTFVWQSLRAERQRGGAVLLISSDLDELFDISDRIVVMLAGKVAGEFIPPYSREAIGKAMTGVGR
jgi:simple sugar transport system ATP-binding protein